MSSPAADRNLLFGILALQMGFISREDLVATMNAWVLDKSEPLGILLQRQGALPEEECGLLDALVEKHLQRHGNDPDKSLATLSSIGSACADLSEIADPDVQRTLTVVSRDRRHDDPDATITYSVGAATSEGQRFRVLRPHSEGGLGRVSVARDEELNREVALKELKDDRADSPEGRARFLLEARRSVVVLSIPVLCPSTDWGNIVTADRSTSCGSSEAITSNRRSSLFTGLANNGAIRASVP